MSIVRSISTPGLPLPVALSIADRTGWPAAERTGGSSAGGAGWPTAGRAGGSSAGGAGWPAAGRAGWSSPGRAGWPAAGRVVGNILEGSMLEYCLLFTTLDEALASGALFTAVISLEPVSGPYVLVTETDT